MNVFLGNAVTDRAEVRRSTQSQDLSGPDTSTSGSFTLCNLDGATTIIDFGGAEGDRLDVSVFNFADFAAFSAVLAAEGPGGHDTRIRLDADTVVIVENITPDDLVALHVIH